jgi:putative hydrolase
MLSVCVLPAPDQDMHIHSTFSDGAGTIEENVAAAERQGLARMRLVDHVRESTAWTGEFVREVRRVSALTEIAVSCGLEAKLLDVSGALDLPADTGGADFIYVADHQVPLSDGPVDPARVREAIADGELDRTAVISALIDATTNAVERWETVVIAHLFSVLPKIGCSEGDVPIAAIEGLAAVAAAKNASVEIDERWRCPSVRTLRVFHAAGVPILLSTDSHSPETIGRYGYCAQVVEELAGGAGRA